MVTRHPYRPKDEVSFTNSLMVEGNNNNVRMSDASLNQTMDTSMGSVHHVNKPADGCVLLGERAGKGNRYVCH